MVSESKYFPRETAEERRAYREHKKAHTFEPPNDPEFIRWLRGEGDGYAYDPDTQAHHPAQLKRELDQMWRFASDRAMPETKWESGCGGPPRHVYCGQCGGVSQDQRCTVCGCAAPGQAAPGQAAPGQGQP